MTPLQQKYLSGKVLKPTSFLPIQGVVHPNFILIGTSPNFLSSFIDSQLVKPIYTKTVYAPRILRLPNRPKSKVSPGSIEAHQLKDDNRIRTILYNLKDTTGESIIFDMSNHVRFADETMDQVTVRQRHEIVQSTIKALIPAIPVKNGMQVFFIEVPLGERELKARLSTPQQLNGFIDHVAYDIIEGAIQAFGDTGTEVIFFVSSDFKLISRIDITDKLTDTRQKRLAALTRMVAAVEVMNAGNAVGDNVTDADTIPVTTDSDAQAAVDVIDVDAVMANMPQVSTSAPILSKAEIAVKQKFAANRVEYLKTQMEDVPFITRTGGKASFNSLTETIPTPPIVVKQAKGTFIDEDISRPTYDAITSTYLDSGLMDRDMASVFASLSNDPLVPHYIQKVERVNSSDSLNLKETVSVQYKDERGRSSTVHIDLPIFTRDGYMVLNGNKYSVTKQIMAMPIIKVRPNEVLITTAYNKATVERFGQNASATSSYIRLLAARIDRERISGITTEIGSASAANTKFRSTVEYDDIARTVRSIITKDAAFIFSRPALNATLKKVSPWFNSDSLVDGHPVGYTANGDKVICAAKNGSLIAYNKQGTQPVYSDAGDITLSRLIYNIVVQQAGDKAASFPAPSTLQRKYMYSRVKMLSQYLPTAVIVGYNLGLTDMLKRMNVTYSVISPDQFRRGKLDEQDAIQFSDAVLVYSTTKLRDSILLNGLKELDTADHVFSDFAVNGQGWVEHIADRLGGPGHAKALINYQTSFIDPMTRDLLISTNLPTDMAGVLIYASNMLDNNEHADPNSMESYRLRGPELVNTILYKTLHREMERVRATRESASPQKLMVNQLEVIRLVQNASNVEEVSELNPLLEAELRGKATWTGAAGGLSDGRTVNRSMRAYHKSMHGIFGYYSPDSGEIGVKRSLAYGTSVVDARGRFDLDLKRTKASQVLALGELITPFVSRHADSPRIGMQSKQATHTMPIVKHTPQLIGSGAEKALANGIGNTFAYKSKSAGMVLSIDDKNNLVKLKYDNGEIAYIDMSARSVKNSGGGFYITTQLKLNPGIKVGAKFDAHAVLAHDPLFFAPMGDGSTTYKNGLLTRVAITPLDQTYEDSLMITHKLMKDTVSLVTMSRVLSLGVKANLQSIAKVGDVVSPNSSLAVFENVTDDGDISALLQRVGKEFESSISELTRNTSSAKYAGKIVEMRTYYNRDIPDLSQSLQKFIQDQERIANQRKLVSRDAPTDEPVRVNAPIRITRDKVGGEPIDGVLVIFLIQIEDMAAAGDKYVTSSPLKGIVSRVLEEGEEPVDESGKQVDYILSPLSVISRMTSDAFLALWTNSVLVDLKSQVLEIYSE